MFASFYPKLSKAQLSTITLLNINQHWTDRVTSLLFARAVAQLLPMPPDRVESVSSHLKLTHGLIINNIITRLNEGFVVDYAAIESLVVSFYTFRYNQCYPSNHKLCLLPKNHIRQLSGYSEVLSDSDIDLLDNACSENINQFYNFFVDLCNIFMTDIDDKEPSNV